MRSLRLAALCKSSRAIVLRCLIVLAMVAPGLAQAQEQAWPSKPVRIVVPFAVGGTTDLLPRLLGKVLSESKGQPFLVENKTGAGGSIASSEVARAAPDGHTLLVTTASTHSIAPNLGKLPYDTVKDFTPIIHLADSDLIVLASPSLGAKNVQEMIALARSKPGTINYTSSGVGTTAHLVFELLNLQAGIALNHIPYRGSGSAIQDLMSGVVHLSLDASSTGYSHVKSGRLVGLASTGPTRSEMMPEIPTVAEAVPGFSVMTWFGLYGPRGMTPELTQRINDAFAEALKAPEIVERYRTMGLVQGRKSPADFAAMVANDSAQWARIVKDRNIKID